MIDRRLHIELAGMMVGSLDGFGEPDFGTPDYDTRRALQNNLFAFSGAKSYSQLKEMNSLLLDADGNTRSYSDFKKLALEVHTDYNRNWLRTEYNTAIGNAQMAGAWNRYQENTDVPNITIYTAGDDRVRDEHVGYDGFTRRKDDPIWKTFWPPFDWSCRCDAVEGFGEISSHNPDITTVPPLFRNNPGVSGVVFQSGHPYFKDVDGSLLELEAVKNYGMRNMSKIYADANKLPQSFSPQDFTKWFDRVREKNGYATDDLLLPDKWSKSVRAGRKAFDGSPYAEHILSTLTSPSEVWLQKNGTNTYLKFYRQWVSVARVDKKGNLIDFATLEIDQVEDLRKGILMQG